MTAGPGRLSYGGHVEAIEGGHLLRVVNYHNTPRSGLHSLRRELAQYAEKFRALTLADLDAFFATGVWPDDRPGFVPVFYEGYRNSYDVAGKVCDELGITGWFAVCTGFVDCPVEEQEIFARSHYIGLLEEELVGGRIAMTWEELGELSGSHVVFPHTASHDGIADVVTDEDIEREIVEPKRKMEAATGTPAALWAWLHGSPYGASPRHDEAIRNAGYRYQVSNTMLHRIG